MFKLPAPKITGRMRLQVFSVDEIRTLIEKKVKNQQSLSMKSRFLAPKQKVKLTRAKNFLTFLGCTCVHCKTEGSYFALEQQFHDKTAVLEFYGINAFGEEVMMTVDHKIATAKGGPNTPENKQTMCRICNGVKLHHDEKILSEFYPV